MKTMMLCLIVIGGCSDEADIGIDSSPVTCAPDRIADVAGSVENPADGRQIAFDRATPTVTLPPNGGGAGTNLHLHGSENPDTDVGLTLRFGFYCGATEVASYGVIPDDQSVQLECPFEVASALTGQIEFLPPSSGVLIVDESVECLAGRFRVDFGDAGAIGGSFSTPWLSTP